MENHKFESLCSKLKKLREALHKSAITKQIVWNNKDEGYWHKLWSAFDNIEDTQKAIDQFPAKSADYLGVYGLLQAMFVQQTAIKHLKEALGLGKINFSDFPLLDEIRKVRNETIGHPTEKTQGKKPTYGNGQISYTSLAIGVTQQEELEYIVWSKSGPKTKKINLREAINKQQEILTAIIEDTLTKIDQKEDEHIQKFRNDSLANDIAQCDYLISKLWPFEHERSYSKSCLNMLKETYEKFKKNIKLRYGTDNTNKLPFQPGIETETQKIDKLFPRIESMIMMTEGVDELDLEVYVEALENSFREIKIMANEVDQQFNSKKIEEK